MTRPRLTAKFLAPSIGIGLLLAICLLSGCAGATPVLIGLAAELTGKRSEIGVAARDGAQLAIEEINQQGGINHRPLKLIPKDDQGDPAVARQVDQELVNDGVVAIIGHITSQQTAAVLGQINQAKVVLLSPTTSSAEFNQQADYFFRVIASNDIAGQALADHIFYNRNLRRLVGVYDLGNRVFTESQWRSIQTEFKKLGGDADQVFTFTSGQTDLRELMARVWAAQPDGVVMVASAIDTALMAQYARQQGLQVPLFATAWAQTQELIEKGGHAVDGIELDTVYNPNNPFPAFAPFRDRFYRRFRREPEFSAAYAYEAVLTLAEALKQTNNQTENLPQALVGIKNLQGVQGLISLDQFGDVKRPIYITKINNGKFEISTTITN